MSTRATLYLFRALVMLVAIPFHEAAHAYVSWRLGDSTAKDYGRMTLNPVAHFDPLGAICMIAVGVGWAKPVPIRASNFRNPKAGMAISALAGPAANLLLAYVSTAVYKLLAFFLPAAGVWYWLQLFFYYMVIVNVTLGVFNLLPVPPFDGSRLALAFLPQRWYFQIMRYERYIFLAMFLLLMMGFFDVPLGYLQQAMLTLMDRGTSFIDWIAAAKAAASAATAV